MKISRTQNLACQLTIFFPSILFSLISGSNIHGYFVWIFETHTHFDRPSNLTNKIIYKRFVINFKITSKK